MKKLIALILTCLFLSSCAYYKNMTPEQREELRKSRDKYYRMQTP